MEPFCRGVAIALLKFLPIWTQCCVQVLSVYRLHIGNLCVLYSLSIFLWLLHASQQLDLVMMQPFFIGMHERGHLVVKCHTKVMLSNYSSHVICQNSSPCPYHFWMLFFLSLRNDGSPTQFRVDLYIVHW
jgi:hypothetical protein